jgi:hypothetical protein
MNIKSVLKIEYCNFVMQFNQLFYVTGHSDCYTFYISIVKTYSNVTNNT